MGSAPSKAKRLNSSEKVHPKEGKTMLKSLIGHTGGINCMDVSSDLLLTGSDDRTARIWDLMTYECKVVLEGHTGYICCCKLWKGVYALTGSFDKTIRKWNTTSGNCVLKLERHRVVYGTKWSVAGIILSDVIPSKTTVNGVVSKMLIFENFLFTSSYDTTAIGWDLRNGEIARVFKGHHKGILPLAYVEVTETTSGGGIDLEKSKDSLVTGSMDKTAKIWNIATATSLRTFKGHKGAVICLTVDADNKLLFTGSTDNTIRKWNMTNGSPLKIFKGHEGSIISLELHHRLLYSASVDTTARCWVAEFGDTMRKYAGHEHMISEMKYYHGLVFTGSGDSMVRVFDAKSGTLKQTFKGHKFVVNCLMPHQDTMLSGSYDGTVKVWNVQSLLEEKLDGSSSTMSSSLPSSAMQQRRLSKSAQSEYNRAIIDTKGINGCRSGSDIIETTNEISHRQTRIRRSQVGSITPAPERRNENNNSIYADDVGYMSDKSRDLLGDEYWMESLNSSKVSLRSSKSNFSQENEIKLSPRNLKYARSSRSSRSTRSMRSTRSHNSNVSNRYEKCIPSSRTSPDVTIKPLCDDSRELDEHSKVIKNIELIEKELGLVAMETSSNTSGYRTADNCSPTSPVTSLFSNNDVEQPKSRQKSSVSFSSHVFTKHVDNARSRLSSSDSISEISTNPPRRNFLRRRENDLSSTYRKAPKTAHTQIQIEQES